MFGQSRYAATAVFAAVVLIAGILHGMFTHRWVPPVSLDPYVARLYSMPETIGSWKHSTPEAVDERRSGHMEVKVINDRKEYRYQDDLRKHGIEDYIYRIFREKGNSEHFDVLIVCGRSGPISSHEPDVCYRNSGFVQNGEQQEETIVETLKPGQNQKSQQEPKQYTVFRLDFSPPKGQEDAAYTKHIYWGFLTIGGGIKASSSARFEFPNEPVLYKFYVIYDEQRQQAAKQDSMTGTRGTAKQADGMQRVREFLGTFLPELEKSLMDSKEQAPK